jgi:endoglucanase Acf2
VQIAKVKEYLAADTQFGPDTLLGNRGTYWEGKGFNRALQVMNIAEQQGDLARRDTILAAIKKRLELWFKPEPNAERYFHYNAALGTLIGYPDEFGSAQDINDHHFHYGYWIQAAAQIALRDPAWAKREQWGGMVEQLVGDIATAERGHTRFPRLRNFDPYEGHSWAAGLAQFYDGNNQESSSEAINSWAAIILWAEATGNKALRDTGIYLYTHEVEAAQTYWFDLHAWCSRRTTRTPPPASSGANKFVHATWWTAGPARDPRHQLHAADHRVAVPRPRPGLPAAQPAAMDRNSASSSRDEGKAPRDIWQDILLGAKALADPKAALERVGPRRRGRGRRDPHATPGTGSTAWRVSAGPT